MNTKTAKHLRTLAEEESKKKGYPVEWAYARLKELWKKTPRDKKRYVFPV